MINWALLLYCQLHSAFVHLYFKIDFSLWPFVYPGHRMLFKEGKMEYLKQHAHRLKLYFLLNVIARNFVKKWWPQAVGFSQPSKSFTFLGSKSSKQIMCSKRFSVGRWIWDKTWRKLFSWYGNIWYLLILRETVTKLGMCWIQVK